MKRQRIALLLGEFQAMLDRFAADSALCHDLISVNRLETIISLLAECLGEGAVRSMLAEAVYRAASSNLREQRARHWLHFIKRRGQILEVVIAARHRRLRAGHENEIVPSSPTPAVDHSWNARSAA